MSLVRGARGGAGPLSAAALAIGLGAAGCAAPSAERAAGAVAADVERSLAGGAEVFDHAAWGGMLAEATRDGLADYPAFAARRSELDAYLAEVAAADMGALAPRELMALLINAYNALTVVAILDHPGVASIRDIDGVWTELTWTVGGHQLTLDNIEHNVLRPFFRDPRIHFAVNCASLSCAPLTPWAYAGPELEAQLEEVSEAFLSSPANARVEGGRLRVSRYFDWYGTDFTEDGWEPRAESIPAFIGRYASGEVREAVRANPAIGVDFSDYDWALNQAGPGPARAAAEEEPGVVGRLVLRLRESVGGLGWLGPLLYGAAYALGAVLFVPGSALTLGAGAAFGLGLGTLIVFLAANAGATLSFLLARYVLRGRVQRMAEGRPRLRAVDRAVESQGWRVVFLTRLSPVFPFSLQNYMYGLTGVSLAHYVGASLVGMLPGTLLYVYIGAAGVEVAGAAGGAAGWGETALYVAGLLATLAVVVVVTRVARRELDRTLAEAEAEA